MCLSNFVISDADPRSQQETQEHRIPTRKFRNLGVLTEKSRIYVQSGNYGI